jgi:hypothetical protein
VLADTRPDRTDSGSAPELRPEDSLGIVPLKGRTFDPVLVYGQTLPPGVRFIGVEMQDGVVAIIDGPGSPGSPVINQRTLQHITPLLTEALAVPGSGGLVVSTTTYQCWAVSSAALESIIIRQAMPVQRESSVAALDSLHDAMRFIPNGIHGVADKARRLAADPRPAPRAWAFTGFVLAVAMVVLFGSILRTLSIGPHEAFIEATPGLNALARSEFQASLFGLTVTLGLIAACGPMILQVVGLLFSRVHTWALYVFWIANGYDIAVGTQFWRGVFWPEGFDAIYATHGTGLGILNEVGSVVVSGALSLVTSVGMEWGLLLALTMAFALFTGAMAAIGMGANQVFIRTPIRLFYSGRTMVNNNRHYIAAQQQQYELPTAEPYYVVVDTPGYTVEQQQNNRGH